MPVADMKPTRWERFAHAIARAAAATWRPVREHARKLIPSRSVRWTVLYVPAFCVGLLFALKTFGAMDDLVAYVFESGSRSVPILIAIAITYGVATGLGWNLDNDYRARLQEDLVSYYNEGKWPMSPRQFGAFVVLAGEFIAIFGLLVLFLLALLVLQG